MASSTIAASSSRVTLMRSPAAGAGAPGAGPGASAVTGHPGFLEEMFAALFSRASAEPVLRFLDEDSSLRDEAGLFASLPAGPLIRAMTGR